jgi:hypothetical protein
MLRVAEANEQAQLSARISEEQQHRQTPEEAAQLQAEQEARAAAFRQSAAEVCFIDKFV